MTDDEPGIPDIGINIDELPYRRENIKQVKEIVHEERNYTVCEIKETEIDLGLIRTQKEYQWTHLGEHGDGHKFTIITRSPAGEIDHKQIIL